MRRTVARLVSMCGLLLAACAIASASAQEEFAPEDFPLLLKADQITYDRELGLITASGNVEVSNAQRTLLVDTLTYNQNLDALTGAGNIVLMEPGGEVLFAEYMELSGDLRDGIVENLRIVLADRSRFAAGGGRRSDADIMTMSKAVYSPCELCPDDPTRPPLWQVKAVEVIHDRKRKMVEYKDAWLEFAGVPVIYTPYLSHPDPTVKRRTGLLTPSFGSSSELGVVLAAPFFINIDPQKDITLTPIYTSKEGPVATGEYRQLLDAGSLKLAGSITEDSDDEIRGHLLSEGRFDIDDTWRWGFDANRTTDDTYLRRYGFGSESSLTSRLFAEGFRKRNYISANAYAFQGLRETDNPGTTPLVLPMLAFSHVGEADRIGGRTELDASLLALSRSEGTDTRRLSLTGGWRLPLGGPIGDIYSISTSVQGDLYHVNGHKRNNKPDTYNGVTGRIIPQAAVGWRLPLARADERVYQIVEPVAQFVVSPYGGNPDTIPNEDSLDFEFDESNLFSTNRFTGLDRVEGGPRFNYGLRWGVFGHGGGSSSFLIGQSYRPKTDDTFAEGSGLEDNFSDIVAKVRVTPGAYLDVLYRTRLSKDNLEARRNELRLSAGKPTLRVSTNYVFFDQQTDSEFAPREEIQFSLDARISRFWRGQVSGVEDLTDDGGIRSLGLDLIYEDECFVFSTGLARSFFEDRDLKPTDSIIFRLNLKTLGELATSVE